MMRALVKNLGRASDNPAIGCVVLTGRIEDHREAVKAFLEKREPKFQGR